MTTGTSKPLLPGTTTDPVSDPTDNSPELRVTVPQQLKVFAYINTDAINGGYGIPAAVLNIAAGFPDVTSDFILPCYFSVIGTSALCARLRTQSAIRDSDGSSSFIPINIGIDFFTFSNFILDIMAALASCILGPRAEDAPWRIAGPIMGGAFLSGGIYAWVAAKMHHDTLKSPWGKRTLEFCQFMQIISAGTSLLQTVFKINPITWGDFFKVFTPAAVAAIAMRASRKKYPVLYKIGDDVIPAIAYLAQSGVVLTKSSDWAPLFFILLTAAVSFFPLKALKEKSIGPEQMKAITDNPLLLPGRHRLFADPAITNSDSENSNYVPPGTGTEGPSAFT